MAFALILPLLAAFPQDVLHRFDGSSDLELYGRGMASMPDFDGDGHPDLLIGAARADFSATDGGRVEIRSSTHGGILQTIHGHTANTWLGFSVVSCGDLNADGTPDIIAGAVNDSSGGAGSGAVHAFSGATGHELWMTSGQVGGHCGYSMANVGDLDADGVADVLVGGPGAVHNGVTGGNAHVLSGATGAMIRLHIGTVEEMEFGQSVCALDDFDADGISDYAVGGHFDDTGNLRAGSVSIYSGASGNLIRTHRGAYPKAYVGNGIAGTNDLDGDGVGEILVGAPGSQYWGKVHVFSGATGAELFLFESDIQNERFGNRVAAADVNGDGLDDFIIAARYANQETGRVVVYSGADGRMLSQMHGHGPGSRFGQGVVGVGDTNGDGSEEWLAWSAWESVLAHQAGQVTLHSGSPMHTTQVNNLVAGSVVTAVVGGCAPGASVLLAWSLRGAGPLPSVWGSVSLSAPLTQLPTAHADAQGEAHWSTPVPAGMAGTQVWVQGVDLTAGVLTQALHATVQ